MDLPTNRLELTASTLAKEILRYTPAGIPVLALELQHGSTQHEAGSDRQLDLNLAALAMGDIALQLDAQALGAEYRFTGFVAKKSRNSKSIVFHITAFDRI